MDESGRFNPKTLQELSLVLHLTRNTISEARDNIHDLEEARDRAQSRIGALAEELERVRQRAQEAESRAEQATKGEQATQLTLHSKTEQLQTREVDHAGVASDLSTARTAVARLRSQLNRVSAERDVLVERERDFDGIRRDRSNLERQLAKATASVSAQDRALTGLQESLKNAKSENAALRRHLDSEKARAGELTTKLAHAADTVHTLKRERADRNEALAGVRAELAGAKAAGDELDAGFGRVSERADALEKRLSGSQEQCRGLEEQLNQAAESRKVCDEESSNARDEVALYAEEVDRLQRELAEAREAIAAQDAQLAAGDGLREALQLDLDVSRSAITELKEVLAESEEEVCHERTPQEQADASS